MENRHAIVADMLTVSKNKQRILDDLSFSVQTGTITGLIGPSGAGKTTLIRCVAGVQRVSSGELRVLWETAGAPTLRGQVGYEAQTPSVYVDLTVEQNLRYFGSLLRVGASAVDRVIEQVRMEAQRGQLVATLSGGQRARVSLAVALLGSPKLLLLDEPTVGLDPLLRNQLWDLFQELANEGITLLISSHVMDEAERCQNLLLLRNGKLLWHGAHEKLLESTHSGGVEAAFLSLVEGK